MIRRLVAFVLALACAVVLGSVAHSLMVQQAWLDAGGAATGLAVTDRLAWMAHDLVGMLPLYGALVSGALLIAFLAAGLVARFTGLRAVVFTVAGAVALFTMFTLMKMQLGTVGVFGARGNLGLAAQMFAGAMAGLLFARLSRAPADS